MSESKEKKKPFGAFISYSQSADRDVAKALEYGLKRFAKPWFRLRSANIFRDEVNLAASPHLWLSIKQHLDQAAHLILLASPKAADSVWVRKELVYWLTEGRCEESENFPEYTISSDQAHKLLIVLTEGVIIWDDRAGDFDWDRTTALPQCELSNTFQDEPLWVDLRWRHEKGARLNLSDERFRIVLGKLSSPVRGLDVATLVAQEYSEHRRMIRHAAIALTSVLSPKGDKLVSTCVDPKVRLWHVTTGRMIRTLEGHADKVHSAAFSPDGAQVATCSEDGTVRIWDITTGKADVILKDHGGPVYQVAFSADGDHIVTACFDLTAHVWEVKTGKLLFNTLGHGGPVFAAAFSHDLGLVTGAEDGRLYFWDAGQKPAPARPFEAHQGAVRCINFSPDGSRFVTASGDGTAAIWNITASLNSPIVLEGHRNAVYSANFSPEGDRVVTASRDGTAAVWDSASGVRLRTLAGHGAPVRTATFSPDGQSVVTSSDDATVRFWDVSNGRLFRTLKGHRREVHSASFSVKGDCIVTASFDGTAKIWDATDASVLFTLRGHGDVVCDAAFSPSGQSVVTASMDGTAKVWDAITGKEKTTLTADDEAMFSAEFSQDGGRIITASQDEHVARIWNAKTYEQILFLDGQGGGSAISSAEFSPDGRSAVTGSTDYTAWIWNAENGKVLSELTGTTVHGIPSAHEKDVYSVAFSPDGTRVLTASADQTAKIWDAHTRTVLHTLEGHSGAVVSASFSPDGLRVVTASTDRSAKIWNAVTGQEIITLVGHAEAVVSARYSSDGRQIVTSSDDHTAKVWTLLPPGPPDLSSPLSYARSLHLRPLSVKERRQLHLELNDTE